MQIRNILNNKIMITSNTKIKIPKGGMELTFTVEELQKILLKQKIWVEFEDVHDAYGEKLKQKESYKTYSDNCDRVIEFIDENTTYIV